MICKKIKTPANIAWSPSQHKSLIAAGTSQGLINDDFQSFSKLEIFSANNTQQQALVSIPTSSSFSCLAWGAVDQGSTPMGLICGGTDDGSLSVWNPSLVLDSATEQPLSAIPEKDFSRVAQFDSENLSPTVVAFGNGEQSHSIAVASSSGEHISIFDLQSLGEAASLPIRELPSSRQLASRVKSGVEALRWNKRVPQILAVGNSNGSTVIWDLRHNKIAMALKAKSNSAAIKAVAWNPLKALHIATASYSQNAELWDLRNSHSPRTVLENGHENPLAGIDWNEHDARLIVTADEEGVVCLWSEQGSLLHSKNNNGKILGVRWSPGLPSYYALSLAEDVTINSVQFAGDDFVPTWLNKTAGSKFSQFGNLLTFHNVYKNENVFEKSILTVKALQNGTDISKEAKELDKIITEKKFAVFCQKKSELGDDEQEITFWNFVKALYSPNRNNEFLRQLGFAKAFKSNDQQQNAQKSVLETEKPVLREEKTSLNDENESFDEAAFFDKIAARSDSEVGERVGVESKNFVESESESSEESEEESFSDIKDYLVTGNFEVAAKLCLESGNFAEALIIASCSSEIWEKTQNEYLTKHSKGFMKNVMSLVMNDRVDELVKKSKLANWKQTIALVLVYANDDEKSQHFNTFANRLENAGKPFEALLCFVCAGNTSEIINKLFKNSNSEASKLQDLVEKAFLCSFATNSGLEESTQKVLAQYVKTLLAGGNRDLATQFVRHFHKSKSSLQNEELIRLYPALNFPKNEAIQTTKKIGNKNNESELKKSPQLRATKKIDPQFERLRKQQKLLMEQKAKTKQNFEAEAMSRMAESRDNGRKLPIGKAENKVGKKKNLPPPRPKKKNLSPIGDRDSLAKNVGELLDKNVDKTGLNGQKKNEDNGNKFKSQNKLKELSSLKFPPKKKTALKKPQILQQKSIETTKSKDLDNFSIKNNLRQNNINLPKSETANPESKVKPEPKKPFKESSTKPSLANLSMKKSKNQKSDFVENKENYIEAKNIEEDYEDLESLRPEQRAVMDILTAILTNIESKNLVGMEKRKAKEIHEKLKILCKRMAEGKLSDSAFGNLAVLTKDLEEHNYVEAKRKHVKFMAEEWIENKDWLTGVNTLMLLAKRHY